MPTEAQSAMWMLNLCARFHCLPSQIERESADLMRLLAIEELVRG